MRIMAGTIVAAALLLLVGGCASQAAKQAPPIAVREVAFHTVLTAPLGDGPAELGGVFPDNAECRVPASYAVTDDAVLILDTLKRRIVEYRGGALTRVVSVPAVIDGGSIAVGGEGDWYVYDPPTGYVLRLTPRGDVRQRWAVPDELGATAWLSLKLGRGGEVVLAVGLAECRLGQTLGQPVDGLSFRGSNARYGVRYVDQHTARVCADGRDRWSVSTDGELRGVTPLGFAADGRLIAEAVDLSLSRRLLVFALAPDGSVTKSVIDMAAFEAYPTPALAVGQDGELYRLGFTRDRAVLERLTF